MYAKAITERYRDEARLTGLFDINPLRAGYVGQGLGGEIPVYASFDEMLHSAEPDVVIITTVDCFHSFYIRRAFEKGCDVICEKPLAVNEVQLLDILRAEREYGRKVEVTFNCRFMPIFARLKELLLGGAVGEIQSVNLEWMLDTSHGADYFRRWHRRLKNSGGLLVHKATHHFDIVNWLVGQTPEKVGAHGALRFYGKNGAFRGERCLNCGHREKCAFVYRDGETEYIKRMFFDAESADGYYRDRCVFSEEIDIYDNMSLTVKYESAILTYSLSAYNPYEGWRMAVNGTGGRLEAASYTSGIPADEPYNHVAVYNHRGERLVYDMKKIYETHGGGDERMLRMLLRGGSKDKDALRQRAGSREGVLSAVIGVAANKSIAENRFVAVKELLGEEI
jgi:predicted dehydrogenase